MHRAADAAVSRPPSISLLYGLMKFCTITHGQTIYRTISVMDLTAFSVSIFVLPHRKPTAIRMNSSSTCVPTVMKLSSIFFLLYFIEF